MFKSNLKKILITLILTTSTFIIGGCSTEIQEFQNTTFPTQLYERINYNRDIVKLMEDKKVITSETAKTYYSELDKAEKKYLNTSNGISLKSGAEEDMLAAVSKYRRLSRPADFSEYYSKDTNAKNNIDTLKFKIDGKYKKVTSLNNVVVTNMGVANNTDKRLKRFTYTGDESYNFPKNLTDSKNKNVNAQAKKIYDEAQPIVLIDNTSDILVDYTIYTIDYTKATNYDTLLKTINNSIKEDGTIDKKGKDNLTKYFSVVKNTDGSDLKLTDLINTGELSGVSKERNNDGENKPGVDMRIKQNIYIQYLSGNTETTKTVKKNVMDIKLKEFYSDEVDKLCKVLGYDSVTLQDTRKWAMYSDGKGNNIAFLLEYPVYYIQGLQDYGADNNYSEAIIKKSPHLGINLKTKQMVRYTDTASGSGGNEYRIISAEDDEFYLLLEDSGDSSGVGKSSFFISGVGSIDITKAFDLSGSKFIVPTIRIILRDYLEATYAPGSDSNDQGNGLVLFGRKIRFINYITNIGAYNTTYDGFKGSDIIRRSDGAKEDIDSSENIGITINQSRILFNKSDNCACFVDINGNFISSTGKAVDITNKNSADCLKVTDLCDIRELTNGPSTKTDKVVVSPTSGGEVESVQTGNNDITQGPKDKRAKDIKGLSVVKTKKFVEIAMPFPSQKLGKLDYDNDNKIINGTKNGETMHQLFYAVATNSDMFSTNLFDTWINVNTDQASLSWWHSWLKNNNYLYALSDDEINAYLYENYRYELSQEGVIILDLETVHKIQEEMDADKEIKSNQFFRTAFMIVGWALVILSIILVLAWFFDTNVDFGFQILSKITLGLWVPIKYKEDIPNSDAEGRKYITLSDILITALVMSAVGILLILIDVMDILVFLLGTFGIFAEKISQLLTGM